MMRFILPLFNTLAGLASLVSIYVYFFPAEQRQPIPHWATAAALLFIVILILRHQWSTAKQEMHRTFNDKGIDKYMCKWVSRPGRALILSRDLSWGTRDAARSALQAKARARDLIIFMHSETDLSRSLAELGASVSYYGSSDFTPKSRFTILNYGRDCPRIAVGTTKWDKHLVYEYDIGDHPITALSDDLINLLARVSQP